MPKPTDVPVAPRARLRLPDGSRSVRSPWVWRGMFLLSLVALGLCLTLLSGGQLVFAGCWAVIAAGWFGVSMWLWRQNVRYTG